MSVAIAELREWLLITNVQAFLRVIRAGESTQDDNAYRMMVGGSLFDSFRDHPRKVIKAGNLPPSTAAGAYQFLARTWDGLVKQYGFADFSPPNQDLGAVALIKGRKALDAVIAGRFDEAVRLCSREWASLPGSPYGQPTKTLAQAKAVYEQYGGTYAGSSQPIATPLQVKPMAAPILLSLLPSLIDLLPKLGAIFGSGSEVANRNIAAATVVADAVKAATNSPNLQAAIEAMQNDPTALRAAAAAVDDIWPSITEAGGGGIEGARKAASAPDAPPFWMQAPFWISVLFLPLIYAVVLAALGKAEFIADVTSETRAQVIGTVLGVLIGGIVGYFYGTSASSQRKTDIIGSR